jgi:hypothetical protein
MEKTPDPFVTSRRQWVEMDLSWPKLNARSLPPARDQR